MVVALGSIWRTPLALTTPTPLSIWTESAPLTCHVSTATDPAVTWAGVAVKRWMDRLPFDCVRSWIALQDSDRQTPSRPSRRPTRRP